MDPMMAVLLAAMLVYLTVDSMVAWTAAPLVAYLGSMSVGPRARSDLMKA